MDYVPKKAVDLWLSSIGYFRKHMAQDETCFFRAVSDQLYDSQIHHEKIRLICIDHAIQNEEKFQHLLVDEDFNNYIDNLRKHLSFCGQIEMHILADKLKCDFLIFEIKDYLIINATNYNYDKKVLLCNINDNHYDSVYKKEHIDNTAFCQAIAYKLIYENVFGMKDVDATCHAMLHDKALTFNCVTGPPFPYKVAKALDPYQYRNIGLDTWNQSRKDMKDWYLGEYEFKIGSLCIVIIEGNYHECYIQDIYSDNNNKVKCKIYIKSLAEKRIVDRKEILQKIENISNESSSDIFDDLENNSDLYTGAPFINSNNSEYLPLSQNDLIPSIENMSVNDNSSSYFQQQNVLMNNNASNGYDISVQNGQFTNYYCEQQYFYSVQPVFGNCNQQIIQEMKIQNNYYNQEQIMIPHCTSTSDYNYEMSTFPNYVEHTNPDSSTNWQYPN